MFTFKVEVNELHVHVHHDEQPITDEDQKLLDSVLKHSARITQALKRLDDQTPPR